MPGAPNGAMSMNAALSENASAQMAAANGSRPGGVGGGPSAVALKTPISRLQQQQGGPPNGVRNGGPSSPPASVGMQNKNSNSMPPPGQPATPTLSKDGVKTGTPVGPPNNYYVNGSGPSSQFTQEYPPFLFNQVMPNAESNGNGRGPSATPKMGEAKPPGSAPGSSTFPHSTINSVNANDGADDSSPSLSRPSPSTSGGSNSMPPNNVNNNNTFSSLGYDPANIYMPTNFGTEDFGANDYPFNVVGAENMFGGGEGNPSFADLDLLLDKRFDADYPSAPF